MSGLSLAHPTLDKASRLEAASRIFLFIHVREGEARQRDSDSMVSELGSKEQAWSVVRRMYAESPAYREFLNKTSPKLGDTPNTTELPKHFEWQDLPVLTKKSFYSQYRLFDMMPESNRGKIYSYLRSSGAMAAREADRVGPSAKGFFWPILLEPMAEMSDGFAGIITQMLASSNRPTLFIVGLSLGSWAGGENIGFVSKLAALSSTLPITVFSPGNQHDEIVEMVDFAHAQYERVIIACCPSAIYYILKAAEGAGVTLPMEKISFMVTGEPFAEELRLELTRMSGGERRAPAMFSVYGSADTGFSGMESSLLIQIRQNLLKDPRIGEALKLRTGSIPSFFHMDQRKQFFESVNGELVVTAWQGLPLVRYNLEDRVQLFDWKEVCGAMLELTPDDRQRKLWKFVSEQNWPGVAAVYGRSKGCLYLCGTNVFDSMLEEVVVGSSLLDEQMTGHFVVWVDGTKTQQQLHWQIEVKDPAIAANLDFSDRLYEEFCDSLGRLQPEFKEDFAKLYSRVNSRDERVFQFHFSKPGSVEKHPKYHTSIKRRIIQDVGPLRS